MTTPAEREAAYVIDGLMHNDVVQSDIHTDTHGYSEIVFGVTHLLGITFAPRIKNFKKQNIYSLPGASDYKALGYRLLAAGRIDTALVAEYWEDILRFVATIKLKETTATQLFRRLSSFSRQHAVYKALRQFGRIMKSVFLLRYIDDLELRQAIEKQLNKVEGSHKFGDAVYYARNQAVQDQTGALAVLGRTCFHACLMDLGVRDQCGDEFYLLRHHGGKLPVIVLTGYPRMGKATVCMRLGACAVLSKPLDLGPGGLYRELRPALFMGILRRRGNCRGTHPRLWSAMLSFAEHRPGSVREWAYRAHTDERQLTRILETGIAGTPLENLKLLRFFDHVLDLSFLRSVFHLTPRDTGPVTNSGLCRGFRRYYDARTALIESVIQPQADAKSASKSDNVSGTQGLVWID